LTLIENKV